ncbi:hypothetical protein DTO166G4_3878 [Paecilomyces variotii]|nr:hypothetical protein DTO166G4_3878 [Paecilomyces variotii]KAJ9232460.1 hypothetical protein DTO166G5_6245 [Paecilomyces variotii]KAJ9312354.1 hypothetical protein DTO271D3_7370 [Paecilomyces variotii]
MPQDRNLLAKKNVVRSAVKLRPGIPTFLFLQAAWSSSASCIGTNGKDLGPVSHRAYWLNSIRTAVDDDQSLLYRSHLRIHDPTLFAAPAWRCHFRLRTYRHDFTSASTLSIDTASTIIIIIIIILLLRTIFPYPQPYGIIRHQAGAGSPFGYHQQLLRHLPVQSTTNAQQPFDAHPISTVNTSRCP